MGVTAFDSIAVKAASKTSSFTVDNGAGSYSCSASGGAITATLPSAARSTVAGRGALYAFRKTDSSTNLVTIAATGSDTIEGRSTFTLGSRGDFVELYADAGGVWRVVTKRVAQTRREAILNRAEDLIGPIRGCTELFEDFYQSINGYANTTSGWSEGSGTSSGTFTAGDTAGGSMTLSSTSTGSRYAGFFTGNAIGGSLASKKFYISANFAVPTAIDAQAVAYVAFSDGSNTIGVGVFGNLSTANFVLQHSGALAGTGAALAAIDTSAHTFEMWCNGSGSLSACIDGGTVTTVTPTNLSKLRLIVRVGNGSTAAERQMRIDWLAGWFEQ